MSIWEIEVIMNASIVATNHATGTWEEARAWFQAFAETMNKDIASVPASWWEGYNTHEGLEHTLDDDYETIAFVRGKRTQISICLQKRECPRIADIDFTTLDGSL